MEQERKPQTERVLGLLGLAVRAGKVIFGTPMVCDAMRAGKKLYLVAEAENTSDNTHKRIGDRCTFYGVRHVRIDVSTDAFAHALGKSGDLAVVAVTDQGLADGILKILSASLGDGSI